MSPGTIGLISDTHGLLRPEAVERLRGVTHIIHAGDVGKRAVADALADIAPLTVIAGNVDPPGVWPERAEIELGGMRIVVRHRIEDITPADRGGIVIVGHSHKPLVERVGDTLEVNPGSAGPRRFTLPITLALMRIVDGAADVTVHTLVP